MWQFIELYTFPKLSAAGWKQIMQIRRVYKLHKIHSYNSVDALSPPLLIICRNVPKNLQLLLHKCIQLVLVAVRITPVTVTLKSNVGKNRFLSLILKQFNFYGDGKQKHN